MITLPTDPANPWSEGKIYTFGDVEVIVLKAQPYEPVRYYTELHRYGQYVLSHGSMALTGWLAAMATLWVDCPKEQGGYRCKHSITKQGTLECLPAFRPDLDEDDDEDL